MSLSTWLSGSFSHSLARRAQRPGPATASSHRRHTFRPSLEGLEIRLTLSLTTLATFVGNGGESPIGGVIMDSSGNLYGTTEYGGADSQGTVFELAQGGSTITPLASFNGTNGANPQASLIIDSSGNLYGTTFYGGTSWNGTTNDGYGTVFEVAKGSGTITTLVSFTGANGNGAYPRGGVIMDSGGNLYGTTEESRGGYGEVFELAHGSGTITSVNLTVGEDPQGGVVMDSSGNLYGTGTGGIDDIVFELAHGSRETTELAELNKPIGADPYDSLIMDSSGNLYGTAAEGGAYQDGTVFELAHGSHKPTALASFNGTDGREPYASLIMDSSGDLFGTTWEGGASSDGTVFELAQGSGTITTLVSFNGTNGAGPKDALIMDSSGNLYGTTAGGGASGEGTVFELAKVGSGYSSTITTLASFTGANGIGAHPADTLIMDNSGNLYGTTRNGGVFGAGSGGYGTVFEMAQGSGTITTLASFNGSDGADPEAGLIMDSSGNLYGTTCGGAFNGGTVFELAHGSGTITTLATFNGTNGMTPSASLIMDSKGNLYGTTSQGGATFGVSDFGDGTVFELAQGSGTITTLASFNGTDGEAPDGALIMDSSGNLYSTTSEGGTSNDGTVFELAHGSGTITTLASFNGTNGSTPLAGLIRDSGGNLYGTAYGGGATGDGTVFELAHGSGTITTLASFNSADGLGPYASLIMDSSGNLYGTTSGGGLSWGTVFKLAHNSGTITALALFNDSNGDGENPLGGLIMDSSGNLYGTTLFGAGTAASGTVFELSGADALPAVRIGGLRSSTGAGASRTLTANVPDAVGTTDTGDAGTVDLTSNDSTAGLAANDTAAEIGTDPFGGLVPQEKGKPSITGTLFSSTTGSLSADGS